MSERIRELKKLQALEKECLYNMCKSTHWRFLNYLDIFVKTLDLT